MFAGMDPKLGALARRLSGQPLNTTNNAATNKNVDGGVTPLSSFKKLKVPDVSVQINGSTHVESETVDMSSGVGVIHKINLRARINSVISSAVAACSKFKDDFVNSADYKQFKDDWKKLVSTVKTNYRNGTFSKVAKDLLLKGKILVGKGIQFLKDMHENRQKQKHPGKELSNVDALCIEKLKPFVDPLLKLGLSERSALIHLEGIALSYRDEVLFKLNTLKGIGSTVLNNPTTPNTVDMGYYTDDIKKDIPWLGSSKIQEAKTLDASGIAAILANYPNHEDIPYQSFATNRDIRKGSNPENYIDPVQSKSLIDAQGKLTSILIQSPVAEIMSEIVSLGTEHHDDKGITLQKVLIGAGKITALGIGLPDEVFGLKIPIPLSWRSVTKITELSIATHLPKRDKEGKFEDEKKPDSIEIANEAKGTNGKFSFRNITGTIIGGAVLSAALPGTGIFALCAFAAGSAFAANLFKNKHTGLKPTDNGAGISNSTDSAPALPTPAPLPLTPGGDGGSPDGGTGAAAGGGTGDDGGS